MNPCGFPLLPAFLSFYLGTDEQRLPKAPTRAIQGLFVGGLVTAGFLALFVVVGLPVSFGVAAVARSVPWTGLATGVALVLAGLLTIIGVRLRLPRQLHFRVARERSIGAMLMFGVGYGAASLGCTLPLLLTLVGASLGGAKIAVFVAYGVGMGVVLMALSVLIALVREGAARALHPALPYMNRLGGILLTLSGGYLVYYWARFRFGDSATLADDPVVSFAIRFSGEIRTFADGRGSIIVAVAAGIVTVAALTGVWQWRRRESTRTLAES